MKQFISFLIVISFFLVTLFKLSACGGEEQGGADFSKSKAGQVDLTGGLSEFELENGIGPVKEKLELGPIDPVLVKKGEEIFNTKCIACHKLDETHLGPPQRDVMKRRTPEFIMNMILNPLEMQEKHPEIKKYFPQFAARMTQQNLSYDEARATLEFFRELGK